MAAAKSNALKKWLVDPLLQSADGIRYGSIKLPFTRVWLIRMSTKQKIYLFLF